MGKSRSGRVLGWFCRFRGQALWGENDCLACMFCFLGPDLGSKKFSPPLFSSSSPQDSFVLHCMYRTVHLYSTVQYLRSTKHIYLNVPYTPRLSSRPPFVSFTSLHFSVRMYLLSAVHGAAHIAPHMAPTSTNKTSDLLSSRRLVP